MGRSRSQQPQRETRATGVSQPAVESIARESIYPLTPPARTQLGQLLGVSRGALPSASESGAGTPPPTSRRGQENAWLAQLPVQESRRTPRRCSGLRA